MGLLDRLKSVLGLDARGEEPTHRGNVDVTIERTPEGDPSPETEAEAAVNGVEAEAVGGAESGETAEADAGVVAEPVAEPESAEPEVEEPEDAEEPAEAEESTEPDEPESAEPDERIPLEEIKGVGPAYAERLRDAGVDHAGALADADAEELAEETGLSAKRIGRWIDRASDY